MRAYFERITARDPDGMMEFWVPGKGAEIEMVGCDVFTIEGGKLVDNQAYTNGMELARQLGALPPQGSWAEKAMAGMLNLKTRAAKAIAARRG